MIPWLDNRCLFPDINTALDQPNGLLAAGGNLHPETLLRAYSQGIFPWYSSPDPILWWSPNPRTVIEPGHVHISRSMHKLLKKNTFTITCDQAFSRVMHGCAGARNYTDQTWISQDIIDAYTCLHQLNHAHSIEVWQDGELTGGLYGVAIGCMFFGESMFSLIPNASKTGFIRLCQTLQQCGFELLDCQVHSTHLASLGAHQISRRDFSDRLSELTVKRPIASPWSIINNNE